MKRNRGEWRTAAMGDVKRDDRVRRRRRNRHEVQVDGHAHRGAIGLHDGGPPRRLGGWGCASRTLERVAGKGIREVTGRGDRGTQKDKSEGGIVDQWDSRIASETSRSACRRQCRSLGKRDPSGSAHFYNSNITHVKISSVGKSFPNCLGAYLFCPFCYFRFRRCFLSPT